MATGPEHYREAEKLTVLAEQALASNGFGTHVALIAQAQVHATLALAAAMAPTVGKMRGEEDQEVEAWEIVAGVLKPSSDAPDVDQER